jgi:hypothetical protein
VHRFSDQIVTEGVDYMLTEDGKEKGYGENPTDFRVIGVSTFDPEPIATTGQGIVDSRIQLDAQYTILVNRPRSLKLAHDYEIELRFCNKNAKIQKTIKHLQHNNAENSCQWLLCSVKAAGADDPQNDSFNLDDGCDTLDMDNLDDFAVRGLYQFAKFVFPRLSLNEKVIINGFLCFLSKQSWTFDAFLASIPENFLWAAYQILFKQLDLPQSVANFAGIALGKIEDFFFEKQDFDVLS